MGLPGEKPLMMFADHRNMCKFGSPSEVGYTDLKARLKEISEAGVKERKTEVREEQRKMKCM
jgi:hypothetical protein